MSLMGGLYVGLSGLQMGQNALNTTAHNMANVDTIGYTRQQVQQGTRLYNTISKSASAIAYQQIGLGVNYSQVKQVRDIFLDKTYRRESGRSAFYDTFVATTEEVEDIFQELQGEAFAKTIENLWSSVQELAKDPGNSVNQSVFVQRCSEFVTRSQSVYKSLCEYQDDLNNKITQQVNTVNAYGKRIAELNLEIRKIEAGQVEKANDLRDERNQLIDELSAMGHIECRTDSSGNILIQLEGKDFVRSDSANEIGILYDKDTGFGTPYWTHLAETTMVNGVKKVTSIDRAEVFRLDREISPAANTDIGSLKAMLYARGNKRATYKDLEEDAGGGYDTYDKEISQSILMNVQAEFDRLVNAVTTGINEIFKQAADAEWAQNPGSNYMRDPDGNPYTIFNTMSGGDFTVENIIINGEIKQAPSLLGFKKADGKIDQATADALKELFMKEDLTINPHVKTTTNYISFYDDLISLVANDGYVLRGISENQQITVDNTSAAREQVLGVCSDEEMSNMVMFQNAYNAASRYINVVSEMLEHLINTMGR